MHVCGRHLQYYVTTASGDIVLAYYSCTYIECSHAYHNQLETHMDHHLSKLLLPIKTLVNTK